jgi:hypothetical protein
MSGKLKLFLILLLGIFATTGASVYLTQYQTPTLTVEFNNVPSKQLSVVENTQEILAYPERAKYQNIPLASINSPLQGSDPTTLALNFLDDLTSTTSKRKVEVTYPQQNQAFVTVTQSSNSKNRFGEIKYRLEMNSFGRSLFASSPPIWQIVWVGSQVSCHTKNPPTKGIAKFTKPPKQLTLSANGC